MAKAIPQEFLRMIVLHELAHMKEPENNKVFLPTLQYGAGLPSAGVQPAGLPHLAYPPLRSNLPLKSLKSASSGLAFKGLNNFFLAYCI